MSGREEHQRRLQTKLRLPPVTVVRTEAEAHALLLLLSTQDVVAVDTETTSRDAHVAKVVVWSLSWGLNRVVIHRDRLPQFRGWLADPTRKKIFHNAKYDLRVLANEHNRSPVRGFHADCMVLSWFVDENVRHGLKERAWADLHIHMDEYKDLFSFIPEGKKKPVTIPLFQVLEDPVRRETLYDYASKDAFATYHLYQRYKAQMVEEGTWTLYQQVERPFLLLLMAMEDRGVTIDREYMTKVAKLVERRKAMVLHRLRLRAVEESGNTRWLYLNPRSPTLKQLVFDDLGWAPLGTTDTGMPRLNADDVEEFAEAGEGIAILLKEFRLNDRLGTGFVRPILDSLEHGPRVSTDFNPIGTVTGRQSSRRQKVEDEDGKMVKSGMNLQNIPARAEKDPHSIRKAFIAAPGKRLIVADYSQIELRVIAHLAEDKVMLDAYRTKPEKDLHIVTAAATFGIKLPDWADLKAVEAWKKDHKAERGVAKTLNFGLNYGMQAYTLAARLGCDVDEAQKRIDDYFALYSGVATWVKRTIAKAKKDLCVRTLAGRLRRLPGLGLSVTGRLPTEVWKARKSAIGHAERQAINTPVQGGVSDLMKRAMLNVDGNQRLKALDARILVQVHDELIVEVDAAAADEAMELVIEEMERVEQQFNLVVPIVAEGKHALSWYDAKN